MNIETIIQNCGTYIAIGQAGEGKNTGEDELSSDRIVDTEDMAELFAHDYLHTATSGHSGYIAGNPAHASIHTDFNRVIKILDVTADKFTPVNKHADSHQK